MTIRLAAPLQTNSIVDGKGLRMVIWNQGCNLRCPGCHNPETWDCHGGTLTEVNQLIQQIKYNKGAHQGITLSGGDPFLQVEANKEIAKAAHSMNLDVWAYCGQTFEQLIYDPNKKQLLEQCDVLVDGPYIASQRDVTLPFRGSTNQRIIDVKQSLIQHKAVLYEL